MKQIVREGAKRFKGHCGECGCRFTYEREDVHRNYAVGHDQVSCPGCGHSVYHFGESGSRWPEFLELPQRESYVNRLAREA